MQKVTSWRMKKGRRRGRIVVIGNSNFNNICWHKHPFVSFSDGGRGQPPLISSASYPPPRTITLGINHRPKEMGWEEEIFLAVKHVRFPGACVSPGNTNLTGSSLLTRVPQGAKSSIEEIYSANPTPPPTIAAPLERVQV